MSVEASESKITSSIDVDTFTTASSSIIHSRRRIIQGFLVIWIDTSIDKSNQDGQNTFEKLQKIVKNVIIFTQIDEAIDFLTDFDDVKVFLIVNGTTAQVIAPLLHNIPQLDSIYIFDGNKSQYEQWPKEWCNVKNVYTDIESLSKTLHIVTKQRNQDSISVSIVAADNRASDQNLKRLEPSFMYTQIFKEILLETEHDERSIKNFTLFWRTHYINNNFTLKVIAEFEQDYRPQFSIKWYTREYFLYQMLNRALRMLEADTIINMGFFIRDLHHQVEKLHKKQFSHNRGKSFAVYRGQGLSKTDFEKLLKTKGGLISFNNFLSTSPDRDVAFTFAASALDETDTIGVLFKMLIDTSISSAPFAFIQEVSYFQEEEEILFSMHTIFRIDEIIKINNNDSLYQVNLTLTADDDTELRILTERIREEVVGETGWKRMGLLLLKIGQFDKAEQLYNVLLEETSDQDEIAYYYNQLGYVRNHRGDYKEAIEYYERSLEIDKKTVPSNHPSLSTSYNNIGLVYSNMGEYSKALSFHEKALEIFQNDCHPNHPDLATYFNNIGLVYSSMGEYSKALSFFDKALEIRQKILSSNHPLLAISYANIANVFDNIGEYSKAFSYYKKTLEIHKNSLPPDHPDLATTYNNIGTVLYSMKEYSNALPFYEKAVEINEKILAPDHRSLSASYNNIALIYNYMKEPIVALSFYEKVLEIDQTTLPSNHPDFAITCHNIANVLYGIGDYSRALVGYEKALEIQQEVLAPNHPSLATSCYSIGNISARMGKYSVALSFFERAQDIWQGSLPSTHPDLQRVRSSIEAMKKKIINQRLMK